MTGKTWVKKRKECDAEYKELTHINNQSLPRGLSQLGKEKCTFFNKKVLALLTIYY